ncbi:MAG: DUF551 domain-containing protein [Burkholderiaceae bacterium]
MIEEINWVSVGDRLPDAEITVLVFLQDANEPCWPGYICENDVWFYADGMPIDEAPTYWAHMPGGPGSKPIDEDAGTFLASRKLRQDQILAWACNTFGKATADNSGERIRRFAEEAVELAQAVGLDNQSMLDIIEHVYARIPGNLTQEIGQVGVSLLGLAQHLNIDADDEERKEFERIKSLPAEYWQARQNAKAEKGIALKSTQEKSGNRKIIRRF